MRVRIKHDTFVRQISDEVLLWNGHNSGALVVQDFDLFLRNLGKNWISVDTLSDSLSRESRRPKNEIVNDVRFIIGNLMECGMVDIDEPKQTVLSDSVRSSVCDESIGRTGAKNVVEDFYKRHSVPSEFHIDLTNSCTEKCVHCYIPRCEGVFLDTSLATKVLSEFNALQGLTVLISGGECLLHPDFRNICLYCRELGLNIIIFSNLTLCNSECVKFFSEIEPQFINVSLYSMEADVHDKITGVSGSWNKTMKAILLCHDMGLDIRIATPLLRENKESFSALIDFTRKYNIHLIPTYDIVARTNHDSANLNWCCSAQELRHVLNNHKELFYGGWNDFDPLPGDKVCGIGETRICLSANGYYYPCDAMHGYVLADAKECELFDVWNGGPIEKLRRLRNSDFLNCTKCSHRRFCKVCLANNFNITGELFSIHPRQCEIGEIVHDIYGEKE